MHQLNRSLMTPHTESYYEGYNGLSKEVTRAHCIYARDNDIQLFIRSDNRMQEKLNTVKPVLRDRSTDLQHCGLLT